MFETDIKHPEFGDVLMRDSIHVVARNCFLFHLAIAALYTFILLIVEPKVKLGPLTMIILIVYGFMLFWILITNFVFYVGIF